MGIKESGASGRIARDGCSDPRGQNEPGVLRQAGTEDNIAVMKRREFLGASGAALLARPVRPAGQRRPRIAALATTYHVRSHADNFITRFLEG